MSLLWNEDDRDDHEAVAEIEQLVTDFEKLVAERMGLLSLYGLLCEDCGAPQSVPHHFRDGPRIYVTYICDACVDARRAKNLAEFYHRV